jgi:hypothetical protein
MKGRSVTASIIHYIINGKRMKHSMCVVLKSKIEIKAVLFNEVSRLERGEEKKQVSNWSFSHEHLLPARSGRLVSCL